MFSLVFNAQCFQSFSTGGDHSLAIKSDGTLWSWGSNNEGELGLNSNASFHNIPLKIGNETDWAKVFAQGSASFAIKNNGTLWACGSGGGGALGTGDENNKYILTQIGTDTNWDFVTSRAGTLALKTNGTLWGWGANIYGMLNLGFTSIQLTPIQISTETNWAKVVAGAHYSLAIKNNGTLWGCGGNVNGQLGDGSTINRLNFVQIGTDSNWVDIQVGYYNNSLAIKSNGTLWGWGANRIVIPFVSSSDFMFDVNLPDNLLIPTQLGVINNYVKVVAGQYNYIVLKNDNTIWQSTNASGLNQIGSAADWSFIDSGDAHFFALKQDGSLWGKGHNSYGQLGLGTVLQETIPIQLNCSAFLGIKEITYLSAIKIYPNPTNEILFIENPSMAKVVEITLADMTGKIIYTSKNNFSQISMQNFENGFYILNINSENENHIYKIVKK